VTAPAEPRPHRPPRPRGTGSRLAGDTLVYGVGGVASSAVSVLLVPIYARQLGDDGLGITGVLNSAIALALMLVGLALPQAFFRWYLTESHDRHQRAHVLGTTLTIRIVGSLVGAAAVLVAVIPLTSWLYGRAYLTVFALAAPIVLFDSFSSIPLSFLRAERRARAYIVVSLTRAILGSVLILTLVVPMEFGVIGVALGSAIAAAISAFVGVMALVRARAARPRIDATLSRQMLGFALPLVPAGLAGWVLNLSDRPLLQVLTGSEALVGVYTLGYTAGLVTNALVVQPFSLAWGAAHWEIARGDDAPRTFARVLTWFLVLASAMALLLSALGTDILRLLVGPEFEQSRFVIPFSAFAYVLYGAYAIVSSGLAIVGRSSLVAATMGVAAASAVGLNLVLIPVIGIFGAATSTLASYLLLTVLSGGVSQRHYPVPWRLGRVSAILGVAGALSAAALLGPDHTLWRVGCLLAYAPILVALRVVVPSEARAVLGGLLRRG
jgi:O-antigen/teichoic acid export membrane protein